MPRIPMAQPTVPLYIRLDPDLAARMDARAEQDRVPRVEVIRRALEKYLEEDE